MRATLMYGAGDVRVEQVPDSVIKLPTDALVRITASCICGTDLWPYGSMEPEDGPARMGGPHQHVGREVGDQLAERLVLLVAAADALLRTGQRIKPVQTRGAQLMRARERELHLKLHTPARSTRNPDAASRTCSSNAVLPIPSSPRITSTPLRATG